MENITLTKTELKNLLKDTVKETLTQLLIDRHEILEYIEDYYFGKILKEAEKSGLTKEEEIIYEFKK